MSSPIPCRRSDRRFIALACLLVGVALGTGCARQKAPDVVGVPPLKIDGSVSTGTFLKRNTALLNPRTPVKAVYSVGDTIFVYSSDNTVYALSDGLDVRYVVKVAGDLEKVRPPVMVKDETIFPTDTTLEVYSPQGALIRSIKLHDPLTSNVRVDESGMLVAGTAAPSGGMLTLIDPKKQILPDATRVLIGNVLAAPAVIPGIVFAANEVGEVYAVDKQIVPLRTAWGLEDNRFRTAAAVTADLVVDDFALYVASTDTRLYALEPSSGRIKWRYPAEVALRQPPLVTKEWVYQVVPGRGLAALQKTAAGEYRTPVWTAANVTKALSADDRFVYAIEGRDRMVALGRDDGAVKFSVAGAFDYFIAGPDQTLYAVTDAGAIVSFQRGAYTGGGVAQTNP